MLDIRLPLLTWEGAKLEEIYTMFQSSPELGFLFKAGLKDHIRENESRGTLWAAYRDEQLVGVATLGSRRAYAHLARHGEIHVPRQFRRQRIGTCLYFVQVLQALLEGRREMEDTIIPALSPWMSQEEGFLSSLKYKLYGVLPARTGGFKDVMLWGKETIEVDDYSDRLPNDLRDLHFRDTPKMRETFEKNIANYSSHNPRLAEQITSLRQWVFDAAIVEREG